MEVRKGTIVHVVSFRKFVIEDDHGKRFSAYVPGVFGGILEKEFDAKSPGQLLGKTVEVNLNSSTNTNYIFSLDKKDNKDSKEERRRGVYCLLTEES